MIAIRNAAAFVLALCLMLSGVAPTRFTAEIRGHHQSLQRTGNTSTPRPAEFDAVGATAPLIAIPQLRSAGQAILASESPAIHNHAAPRTGRAPPSAL